MSKWEYKSVCFSEIEYISEIEKNEKLKMKNTSEVIHTAKNLLINKQGEEGWELVSAVRISMIPADYEFFFKRTKTNNN